MTKASRKKVTKKRRSKYDEDDPKKPHRDWVFTWPNWTPEDYAYILALKCLYVIIGKEICPTTSTPHLQGYIEFKDAKTFNAVRKLLKKHHCEYRKGPQKNNINYCKKDGEWEERGKKRPGQGHRGDLEEMYEQIKEGKNDYELQEFDIVTYMRNYKACDRVRYNFLQHTNKNFTQMKCYYIHGTPNQGKSSAAHALDPDVYTLTDYRWWDGYCGQKTILIDDFNGEIPYKHLANITDGYHFNLPIKGGFTWKAYDTVIVTSNQPLWSFYPIENHPALDKRFTQHCAGIVLPGTSVENEKKYNEWNSSK